jgi:hypothetical protein
MEKHVIDAPPPTTDIAFVKFFTQIVGFKKSMFAAQNAEREQLERERKAEGIQ